MTVLQPTTRGQAVHLTLQLRHLTSELGLRGLGQLSVQRRLQGLLATIFVVFLSGQEQGEVDWIGASRGAGLWRGAFRDLALQLRGLSGMFGLQSLGQFGEERRGRLLLPRLLVLDLETQRQSINQLINQSIDQSINPLPVKLRPF